MSVWRGQTSEQKIAKLQTAVSRGGESIVDKLLIICLDSRVWNGPVKFLRSRIAGVAGIFLGTDNLTGEMLMSGLSLNGFGRKVGAAGLMLALYFTSPAQAAIVSFNFTGIVGTGFGDINSGDLLTGSFSYDTSTAARAGSDSNFAVFDALTSLSVTAGSYSASLSSALPVPEIQVDNDPGAPNHDRFGIASRASDGLTGPDNSGFSLDTFLLRLDDSSDSVFANALLLPSILNFADFDSGSFFFFFSGTDNSVDGRITGFTQVSNVPIPAALPLLASAIAGFGLLSRRRRNSRRTVDVAA